MKRDYGKEFKELVESIGYELLEEYKGSHIKVKIRCNNGHEYSSATPNEFKKGRRCPECPSNYSIQAKKDFLELLASIGYELLEEYKNTSTKVKLKCNKGHEYKVTPNEFKKGSRCPECPRNYSIQAKKDFIELLAKEKYELIGEYKNTSTKVKLKCNYGHEYSSATPNKFKSGQRCPICFESRSQKEIYIFNYVISIIDEEVISGDRTNVINPKTGNYLELDIWIPELRKAIEFNGTYWHSSDYSKYKDSIKREYCNKNGIELMVIEEEEYDTRLELCLSGIDNFLVIEKSLYECIFGMG